MHAYFCSRTHLILLLTITGPVNRNNPPFDADKSINTEAMEPSHNYGPACRLAPVEEPSPEDVLLNGIPPINAQFFYHSLIPIDDPLSTATVAPTSDTKSTKTILRAFSHADNNALERAWLSLASPSDRETHHASLTNKKLSPALAARNAEKLQEVVQKLVHKHKEKHAQENQPRIPLKPLSDSLAGTALPVCCQELLIDVSTLLRETFCDVSRKKQRVLDQESVVEKIMTNMIEKDQPSPIPVVSRMAPQAPTSSPRTEGFVIPGLSTSSRGRASSLISNSAASRSTSTESHAKRLSMASTSMVSTSLPDKTFPKSGLGPVRPPIIDDGISGKPFLKVGDRDSKLPLDSLNLPVDHDLPSSVGPGDDIDHAIPRPSLDEIGNSESDLRSVEVSVGVSKLHMVSLPVLQMKPIYWSPVNDISMVSRSTWFYRSVFLHVYFAPL